MAEERELYIANDFPALNQVLGRISDRLDEMQGIRGTPTFYAAVWNLITDTELAGAFFPGETTQINKTTNITQIVTPITFRPIETADLEALTPSLIVNTDSDGLLETVSDLTAWIGSTPNRVSFTNDEDGTGTLTGPQDIHTGATPTFAGLDLGLTDTYVLWGSADGEIVGDSGFTYDDSNSSVDIAGHIALGPGATVNSRIVLNILEVFNNISGNAYFAGRFVSSVTGTQEAELTGISGQAFNRGSALTTEDVTGIVFTFGGIYGGADSPAATAVGFRSKPFLFESFAPGAMVGYIVENLITSGSNPPNALCGIRIENQTGGVLNRGLELLGDDDGSAAFFGSAFDSKIGHGGDSLNIVANLVEPTDSLQLTAGSYTFNVPADTDNAINFFGTDNLGLFTWMHTEDYFKYSDDILMNSTEKVYFNSTLFGINSDGTDLLLASANGFDFKSKVKITSIGGIAIKLTNKTGVNTIAGQLIKADTATDDGVILTEISDTECFGVFLDDGITDDAEAWVVVAGIADVAFDDDVAAVHGTWVATGAIGYARTQDSPASAPQHFDEIGHSIESVTAGGGGTHILARCVLHFN